MTKYRILTFNRISAQGLHRFPGARYAVGPAVEHPDAIVLRSHDLHGVAIPASVKAIERARMAGCLRTVTTRSSYGKRYLLTAAGPIWPGEINLIWSERSQESR